VKSIESLSEFLKVPAEICIKTLAYLADEEVVGACILGHRTLNEIALKNATGAMHLELLTDEKIFAKYGLAPGFLGPIGWPENVKLFVDPEVMALEQAVTGANQVDFHLKGVVPALHIASQEITTLRTAQDGDLCPRCQKGHMRSFRGIEVGHIFKLGTKYSKAMNACFLDEQGRDQAIVMGCYGIGVGRTMAAAIEQNHDDDGISWPVQIAPFHVMLLNLDPKDEHTTEVAEFLYKSLWKKGIEVLLDDTSQRPGFKFKDADLLGLPVQITLGSRTLREGNIEVKIRKTGTKETVPLAEAESWVVNKLIEMGWQT
jgi:prolyl-tRNA synthetase